MMSPSMSIDSIARQKLPHVSRVETIPVTPKCPDILEHLKRAATLRILFFRNSLSVQPSVFTMVVKIIVIGAEQNHLGGHQRPGL